MSSPTRNNRRYAYENDDNFRTVFAKRNSNVLSDSHLSEYIPEDDSNSTFTETTGSSINIFRTTSQLTSQTSEPIHFHVDPSRALKKYKAPDDLESWWIKSGLRVRLAVAIAIFCFAIFLLNFAAGVYFIITHFVNVEKIQDPYECTSLECRKAAIWMQSTMDTRINPCDNFYQFVCGNHAKESASADPAFDYLNKGGYPVHPGEQSILSNILKGYFNDSLIDQGIKYYQVCLNTRSKMRFEAGGIIDAIAEIFGTKDFTKFETLPDTLEEIGARMMRMAGHASFINIAFFTYPFVQIQRPSEFSCTMHDLCKKRPTAKIQREIAQGIMKQLGVPVNSTISEDFVQGIHIMVKILSRIREVLNDIQIDNYYTRKSIDTIMQDAKFIQRMETHFVQEGLCPPIGLQLDYSKVLRLFLEEDYRLDFSDLMSAKQFAGFVYCLGQNSSKFTYKTITHKKTAFVSLWLIEFFYQFMNEVDRKALSKQWEIRTDDRLFKFRHRDINADPETFCLEAFYENMGYVPLIRYLLYGQYLQETGTEPNNFVKGSEINMEKEYKKFAQMYNNIPATDISTLDKHFGSRQLSLGLKADYVMPFNADTLDVSSIQDDLHFKEDHLKNSLISVRYSIERARMNWKASSYPYPIIRWFGYGRGASGRDIQLELFDFRMPFVRPGPLQEKPLAANGKGQWETFLKRKYFNYILFPISIALQNHVREYRSICISKLERKYARAFLQLLEGQSPGGKYSSLQKREDIVYFGDPLHAPGAERQCYIIDMPPQPTTSHSFSRSTLFDFSFHNISVYNNVLALRHALNKLRSELESYAKVDFNWKLPRVARWWHLNRKVPGSLSQYSQYQILFIATVRDHCRESWKTSNTWKEERWRLEMDILQMLTQTKEFSEIWKCPKKSLMNNNGYPRCVLGDIKSTYSTEE